MRHCWGTMTMPHTRSGHDQDRSRNMRTRNRRLGPLVQHPPPLPLGGITPQQAENQHTTTRKEAASTSLHKTRDLTHPLRGIAPVTSRCTRYVAIHPLRGAAPVTSRCTRYVALHPLRRAAPEQKGCNAYRSGAMPTHRVQCLHIGCTTPRHKLRCGPARMEVDGPDRLGCARRRCTPHNQQRPAAQSKQLAGPGGAVQTAGWARRRSPNSRLGPTAQSKQLDGPDGAVQTAGWARRHQTAGSARGRQGLTDLRDDEPSERLASQTTSGPPSERLASLARHKARARGTHATSPGTTRAYDEAGTRRATQRRGPRPRQQVRPGDPP